MSDEQRTMTPHLQGLIDDIIAEDSIESKEIDVKPLVKPGDNWLGNILQVEIIGNNTQNQTVSLNVVAKTAPTDQIQRNFFPIASAYKREIYMYNFAIPELIKLQKENIVENIFSPFAKCYKTSSEEGNEVLLLKNMQSLGYTTVSHRHPVSYDHASLAMKYYGKFHALSFALQAQKPEIYEEIRTNIVKSIGMGMPVLKLILEIGTKVLNYLEKDEKIYNVFQKYLKQPHFVGETLIWKEPDGPYKVILHGDSQLRNMLFKYEGSNPTVPTDLCLIDWQLSIMNNPCFDIAVFLWVCTDKQLRNKHYFELIDLYYESFSSFLKKFQLDSEKIYPRVVFEKHLKRYSSLGLFASIWCVGMNLLQPEEVPDGNEAENSKVMFEMLSNITSDEYFLRIRDNIIDFIEYDYILNAEDFYASN
ncbi:hypothetical protein FQR65_LT00913 [Abscondita terminalis]|nr:hypothetical protein FQR65_LT00913 [Abscondita terminalis]